MSPSQSAHSEIDAMSEVSPPDGGMPDHKRVRWGAAIGLALALVLVVSAAGYFIGTQLVAAILPSSAMANKDDILVIFTNFSSGSEDEYLYDEVSGYFDEADIQDIRIEWLDQTLETSEQAWVIGNNRDAALVIWGAESQNSVTPYYEAIFGWDLVSYFPELTDVALVGSETQGLDSTPSELEYTILFMLGQAYYYQDDFDTAYRLLDQALTIASELENQDALEVEDAYYFCAYIDQVVYQHADAAIDSYTRAIEIDSQMSSSYYARATAYSKLGDDEQAVEDYSQAIRLGWRYAEAYYGRGVAYQNLGEYVKAIEDYSMAILIDSSHASAYYNRAIVYYDMGEYEKSVEDCTRTLELRPNDSDAYYSRGLAYDGMGEYENSVKDYTRVIQIEPNYVYGYSSRAYAYVQLADYEQAVQDFTRAIEIDADIDYAGMYFQRGLAYSELCNYAQAISDLDQAIDMDPQYVEAYLGRGMIHQHLEEVEQATADFQRVLELASSDSPMYAFAVAQLEQLHD